MNHLVEQLPRFREVVCAAYTQLPYFAKRMDLSGLAPQAIASPEDIRRVPFTTKEDLQTELPLTTVRKAMSGRLFFIGFTTGTVSRPMPFFWSHQDYSQWERNLAGALSIAGLSTDDVVMISLGRCGTGCITLLGAVRHAGAAGFVADSDSATAVELIERMSTLGVSFLLTYPALVSGLCDAVEAGLARAPESLRVAFLMGESWPESLRSRVRSSVGAEVYDLYGSTEIGFVGVECSAHDGLHVFPEQILVEVLDPESYLPTRDGEMGEIVLTTLWKEVLPLVRYRTGDLAATIESRCSCGQQAPRISRIKGRVRDTIFIGSTKIHPAALEAVIGEVCGAAYNHQVVLHEDSGRDEMRVLVEIPSDIALEPGRKAELAERIIRLHEDLATMVLAGRVIAPQVEFVACGSLKRQGGKLPKLVDQRSRHAC
jgi:phenylacetate-CoA ligase